MLNDPETAGLIGSETKEVSKESFSSEGFNDAGSMIPCDGKQTVENRDPPKAGFNDDDSIIEVGHTSG